DGPARGPTDDLRTGRGHGHAGAGGPGRRGDRSAGDSLWALLPRDVPALGVAGGRHLPRPVVARGRRRRPVAATVAGDTCRSSRAIADESAPDGAAAGDLAESAAAAGSAAAQALG